MVYGLIFDDDHNNIDNDSGDEHDDDDDDYDDEDVDDNDVMVNTLFLESRCLNTLQRRTPGIGQCLSLFTSM